MQQAPYFSLANLPEVTTGKFVPSRPKAKTVKLWGISLVLHSIVIVLIFKFGALQTKPLQETPPLNSYLFVPLKPSIPAEVDEVEKTKDTESIVLPITDVPKQEDQIFEEVTPKKQANAAPELTTKLEPNEPIVLTNQNNKEVSRIFDKKNIQTSERVKQAIMHQMDIAATQALVGQASRDHQKAKLSPNINTITSIDTWALPDVAPITEVDCASTGKQVMAALSGLMHGTLHCRDSSNFQKYIDKHLNKNDNKKP